MEIDNIEQEATLPRNTTFVEAAAGSVPESTTYAAVVWEKDGYQAIRNGNPVALKMMLLDLLEHVEKDIAEHNLTVH